MDHAGLQWLDEMSRVPDRSLLVLWIDMEAWDCLGISPLGMAYVSGGWGANWRVYV